MGAKIIHKKLSKAKKNPSIVSKKKGRNDYSTLIGMDEDSKDLLVESRNKKMMFENKRHEEMKIFEEKRIKLEEKRLKLEECTTRIKNESILLQNNLERSKIVLLKLEMFEKREEIKRNNPNIMDDYLNNLFPYPE